MKDLLQLVSSEAAMSTSILTAIYDIDMLYKPEKNFNMNALHFNNLLDKKAVGAPLSSPASATSCPIAPGFFRRNSAGSTDLQPSNGNKYTYKDSSSTTAMLNKENSCSRYRERAFSEGGERTQAQPQQAQQKAASQINSTRYKTELCRPFEENGACKYGEKCQFAHGYHELRSLSRHPKYKTEPCRTFHTIGFCPYGPRCHFIHNADERRPAPASHSHSSNGAEPKCSSGGYVPRDAPPVGGPAYRDRPKLHHSLSFAGFSTQHGLDSPLLDTSPTSRTPPPPSSGFYEDALAPSPFSFPAGQDLKALLAPLAVQTAGGYATSYYGSFQTPVGPPSPPYNLSHLQALQRLSESPVFDSPPSPPDSISDRDSFASGSLSSSGSLSGSESPSLDGGRRLPIFSRLSISDD
ncbi:mRNA decay activator protein ZFP36L2-B [Astyanax mexicanus]|uniref:mRNA decay activator protein ZFP36L2-B n=1 Tax=Astyanax mexicanus TaxID=7994 RepID=UPI0020CB2078|nr:mRNA decay activator protein ZFP36L2-B [Astyanax mexicanus]